MTNQKNAGPRFFAYRVNSCAQALTCATVPGAAPSKSVQRVCIESIMTTSGLVAINPSNIGPRDVSAAKLTGASVRPSRFARRRICAVASSPEI